MAKPKDHTALGIKRRRRREHAPSVEVVDVVLAEGDTAWHPFADDPIPGPAAVAYYLHEDGEMGVVITPGEVEQTPL